MSKLRANQIVNKASTGAPTAPNGLVVTGVSTATSFSGSGANLTSLPAANLTGTLPAISGANLTNLDASDLASGTIPDARFPSTLPAVSGANLTGIAAGVSEIDHWIVTTNFNGSVAPISGNLTRYEVNGVTKLGTGMSVSSGVWTFPSTGYWRITVKFRSQKMSGAQSTHQKIEIKSSTDNFSSSNILAVADSSYYDNYPTGGRQVSGSASIIFDCTNTSTHKIRFAAVVDDNSGNGNEFLGSSTVGLTTFEFIKLADT